MNRAVIYARYSSDRQDSASIETQLSEARKKATALNLQIVAEYCDEATSARTTDRPEFQRLLSDAKQKRFDIVLVRKFDRFARNVTQSRIAKEYLKKLGVKVVSVHEDIEDSPAGQFMETLVEAMAEWYSANLAAETKSGQTTNALKGFRNGGCAPYGYKNVKVLDQATGKTRTKLEIFEPESRAVSHIFNRFSLGIGYSTIISELNERGLMPRTAKQWNKSVLVAMIDNQAYAGRLIWRKSPEEVIVTENAVPRIVDEKTWEICQAKRKANSKAHRPRGATSDRAFTGLLYCGYCGSPYAIANTQRGKAKLTCISKKAQKGCTQAKFIDEQTLIADVKQELLHSVFTPANLERAFKNWSNELKHDGHKASTALKKLKAEIIVLERRQSKLLDELESGDFPRELLKSRMSDLEAQRKGLLLQAEDLQRDASMAELKPNRADLNEFCAVIRSSLVDSTGKNFREKLLSLGVKITIRETAEIEISPASMTSDIRLLGAGSGVASKRISPLKSRIPLPNARAAVAANLRAVN